jgi:hypothetical protein
MKIRFYTPSGNYIVTMVKAPTGPSPLQTAINTVHSTPTEPWATGGYAKKPKSSDDVLFFFREDKAAKHRICMSCEYILCLHQHKTFVLSYILYQANEPTGSLIPSNIIC